GGWVVAWQGSDADLGGIYYQRFNAAGGAIGVAVRVNDIQANNQTFASVVGTDDGGWIITWSSDDDDTSIGHYQIHQKRYDSGGAAVELGIGGTPPRAADVTVKLTEDHSYLFSKKDFHYFDYDGDKFAHVTIVTVPDTGVLKLGGSKVHDGDVIAASALSNLKFVPAKNQIGEASFEFSVGDKSGKESHLSYSFAFEIKDVVDTFRGNKKANTLDGTDGSDILDGKQGNDTLTGGDSSDRFVFKTGYDRDAITDFAATGTEHDVVDLRGLSSVKNWNDLVQHHMSQVGDDVVINGLKGDVLTLQHVQLADLDKGDFLF
ncbi:MAG: hypothetical protein KDJ87_18785, partial [Rhizobiaceae bacterium]|nr:hypothetical protein [Rhizobiaceae bacterium]